MKKFISFILILAVLFSMVAPAIAEEEKSLQMSSIPEGTGDKVHYPWQNLLLLDSLMFRTLFLADTDLVTLKDDLAKADYKLSNDRLTYTIEFIDGSKWSDGETIKASDVAFSIKFNLRAAISNGIFTTAFNKIEGASEWKDGTANDLSGLSVDGNIITIKLSSPYSAFASTLAQFAILPEHVLKDEDPLEFYNSKFWTNPITSGMFKVGEMNPGNFYTLVFNDQYTGTKPKITKIINHFVNDNLTAVQSGLMDCFNTNSPGTINEIAKQSNMMMFPVDILFYRYFICNIRGVDGNENPVMQDKRVREALLYAIDRKSLAESLFPELAYVVNSGVPNTYPEYNGINYEYNPEKAKSLLEEAGYDFSHKFTILYYYNDQTSIDFMEAIAYYLGEIGMNVNLIQSTQGTTDLFQTRNYDIGYKGLSAFNIGEWYNEYASTNANFKNIFGGEKSFDDLISSYVSSATPEETSKALIALQQAEQSLMYKIPLYTIGNNIFINTDHVKLPENIVFGNPWYKTDIGFEQWELR